MGSCATLGLSHDISWCACLPATDDRGQTTLAHDRALVLDLDPAVVVEVVLSFAIRFELLAARMLRTVSRTIVSRDCGRGDDSDGEALECETEHGGRGLCLVSAPPSMMGSVYE